MKLTVQDLAMFLGSKCEITEINVPETHVMYFAKVGDRVYIDGFTLLMINQGVCQIKPILRPLSDMTIEEYNEWTIYRDDISERVRVNFSWEMARMQDAEFTRWFIRKHFDVFGWIGRDLAIDKTKL